MRPRCPSGRGEVVPQEVNTGDRRAGSARVPGTGRHEAVVSSGGLERRGEWRRGLSVGRVAERVQCKGSGREGSVQGEWQRGFSGGCKYFAHVYLQIRAKTLHFPSLWRWVVKLRPETRRYGKRKLKARFGSYRSVTRASPKEGSKDTSAHN